ncbi:hypothetical protein COM77_18955 [Bacillus cereus]|nr:hypothetical protein COM77_18955 [Bacillus cereus]PEE96636.1 hypothetical protein COM92_01135 [Bacillus cereus]PGN76901.1 hypothetical protein CN967_16585 [Bacillus cereus]
MLFASNEGAKQPEILAARAGYTKSVSGSFSSDWLRFFRIKGAFCLLMRKVLRHEELAAEARYIKKRPITGRFFIIMHLRLDTHPGIHLNISAIFQIYRP